MLVGHFVNFSPPVIRDSTEQHIVWWQSNGTCSKAQHGRIVQADIQVHWIHFGCFNCTWRPCSKIFSDAVANYIIYGIEYVKASVEDVPCTLMKDKLQKVGMLAMKC